MLIEQYTRKVPSLYQSLFKQVEILLWFKHQNRYSNAYGSLCFEELDMAFIGTLFMLVIIILLVAIATGQVFFVVK